MSENYTKEYLTELLTQRTLDDINQAIIKIEQFLDCDENFVNNILTRVHGEENDTDEVNSELLPQMAQDNISDLARLMVDDAAEEITTNSKVFLEDDFRKLAVDFLQEKHSAKFLRLFVLHLLEPYPPSVRNEPTTIDEILIKVGGKTDWRNAR